MDIQFVKLHGLGNDFIVIDNMSSSLEITEEEVIQLCDRHFGVGADGVIVVRPSQRLDCAGYMHYINSDGTLAQMCGNGVRCTAKFLVDYGYVDPDVKSFGIETLAGAKYISFEVNEEQKLIAATVNMGNPILSPDDIPVNCQANDVTEDGVPFVREMPIDSPWGIFAFTCVSMGNPHAVCFIDDMASISDELFSSADNKQLATFDVSCVGAFFESHALFPEKTNVEFASCKPDSIDMRVYERGCGETLACGTGACATSVAATLTQRCGRNNVVRLLGGELSIAWNSHNEVMMTGPATEVFTGCYKL